MIEGDGSGEVTADAAAHVLTDLKAKLAAAALLLVGGAAGKRYCLPHSRMMIHQPLGGFQGQASDFEIHAKEILTIRDRLNRIMAAHTGQPLDVIARDTDRDNFMSADEGVAYGLIDKVISKRELAS